MKGLFMAVDETGNPVRATDGGLIECERQDAREAIAEAIRGEMAQMLTESRYEEAVAAGSNYPVFVYDPDNLLRG